MNWGNRLLLAFIVFALGMSLLVYKALNTDYELVEKDYYKQELRYQQVIDGKKEASHLSALVELHSSDKGITLQLPPEMRSAAPTGEIFFYCANNSGNDKKLKLVTDSNGKQLIAKGTLASGSFLAKISWQAGGKNFYAEKDILIP